MSDQPVLPVFMGKTDFPAHLRRDLTFGMRWERHPSDNIAYWCVGEQGAVEFVVTHSTRAPQTAWEADDYRGCFRVHRWSDGSFTLAQEIWIPRWLRLRSPTDVERIFAELQREYATRMEAEQP